MNRQIILEAFRQDNSYILILILIADADYHYHSYYLMPSDSSHDKKFWYLLNLNLKLIIAIAIFIFIFSWDANTNTDACWTGQHTYPQPRFHFLNLKIWRLNLKLIIAIAIFIFTFSWDANTDACWTGQQCVESISINSCPGIFKIYYDYVFNSNYKLKLLIPIPCWDWENA